MKFSSLAALVVAEINSGAVSDEIFNKMRILVFQCLNASVIL